MRKTVLVLQRRIISLLLSRKSKSPWRSNALLLILSDDEDVNDEDDDEGRQSEGRP
jgi:hypothetical protein